MKIAKITDGVYMGKPFTGDYAFVSERKGPGGTGNVVRVVHAGKEINVTVGLGGCEVVEVAAPAGAFDEFDTPEMKRLDKLIRDQFTVMEKVTDMAIAGDIRSLIISGAAGIGKSYGLDKRLTKAFDNEEIESFTAIKGKISAIALFKALFEHREEGNVLVLDDIDSIFQDETSLNLLKGALDTGDVRRLSWLTASTWLEEQGIDQEFEFNGSVVFITNLDFDRMIEKGSNLSVHFKALISRSIYLDLKIHTNKEIMIRIRQVVNETAMLDTHGVDNDQKAAMMGWLGDNYENLREISLRTILKLAAFMKGDPQGWQMIAEATMLRNPGMTPMSEMSASGKFLDMPAGALPAPEGEDS